MPGRVKLPQRLSLQARLGFVAVLVLGLSLGVVGFVLDRVFSNTVLASAEEQMQAVAFGLLSGVEERGSELVFLRELADPRLSQPDSELYAFVLRADGEILWQSPSLLASRNPVALGRPMIRVPRPGEMVFGEATQAVETDPARFVVGFTVTWESIGGVETTIWILEDQRRYIEQIQRFRLNMAIGLMGALVLFVFILILALRWGLNPVRLMSRRVSALEEGARRDIGDDYPSELTGLARNLNRFIDGETQNRERYRRAMADLAHSLKTPLAVLRNALRDGVDKASEDEGLLVEQLDRMETTITYQLARAAAVRSVIPEDAIEVTAINDRLVRALSQAYRDTPIDVEVVPSPAKARVDERDLMEILGNLIENAFKYTRSRVRCSARATGDRCLIKIEDDGEGVPVGLRQEVLKRGARADTATNGQGIGLAVVVELVSAYGGRLEIGESAFGGAAIMLELPA